MFFFHNEIQEKISLTIHAFVENLNESPGRKEEKLN